MAEPADLDALIDDWMREELADQPTRATSLGVDGHDDRLPDLSADAFAARDARDDAYLERFTAIPDEGLTLDQRIDRDLVVSGLRGRQAVRSWIGWRRDPATYLGPALNGVFTLFLHRVHDDAALARFAEARLREVPRLLEEGRANLDASLAPRLFVERALGQCRAGARYARELVPAEVPEGSQRDRLAEAGAVAADAFDAFATTLEELAPRAEGSWALGEETYSRLLREKELLDFGTAELRDRGQAAYDELSEEMGRVAHAIAGTDDWRGVLEELNRDHPPTPEAMRAEYEDWTQRARDFLVEHATVTLPEGERCLVEPSPPFQRPILAVASYSKPPEFKASMTGHFFVPFPPDGTSEAEVQQRLATNSRASIPTIAVHEAYPGHHWHLTWAKVQGMARRPVRSMVTTSYFAEGWALYAERVLREQGFFADPRHDLAHLDARIFRAARIVVDTSLHMGEMGFEEAVEFMRTRASLSEPTARAEVGRYCTWPTQAASYLTGSLEIERIRARYLEAGRGDLRSFHDEIAGSGVLPIGLAERAVMES